MLGAIVLAGGRGSRMGGVDKASVRVGGLRLIDRLSTQLPYGTPTVVVSPHWLGRPQVVESPLYGGPVAGIAAAARSLHTPRIAVLAADAPDSPRLLPRLESALEHDGSDVAVTVTANRIQPLCAVWNAASLRAALRRLGEPRNRSARSLIQAAGSISYVPGTGAEQDFDTPAELAAFAAIAEDIAH